MFYHAYEGYLEHAFPADELMPQLCKGRWRFPNGHVEHRGTLDDGFGKCVSSFTVAQCPSTALRVVMVSRSPLSHCSYSLTLVDALDSLVVRRPVISALPAVVS